MKKQILIVAVAALTAVVVILSGTSAATAQQQVPQYQAAGFPITPLQMSVLRPSDKIKEQQRLSARRTMDASRRAVYPDPGLSNYGY